jgi:hypothetical protein
LSRLSNFMGLLSLELIYLKIFDGGSEFNYDML